MKRKMVTILLAATLVLSSYLPVYADEVDDRIEQIEGQIKSLEKELNSLKEQKGGAKQDSTEEHFEVDLASGTYIPGIDIPIGRYNINAVSGRGNVFAGNMAEMMAYPKEDMYVDSYNGVVLSTSEDSVTVSGTLVIHISSDNAQVNNMTSRKINNEVEADFGPGTYIAGTDFPEGTYNIVCIEGRGNVFAGDAAEMISVAPDDMYVSQTNNVKIITDDTLEVSGCSIRLVPVGE